MEERITRPAVKISLQDKIKTCVDLVRAASRAEFPTALAIVPAVSMLEDEVTAHAAALEDLAAAVDQWRNAACMKPREIGEWMVYGGPYDEDCVGESHSMECPIAKARGDIIAAHNKLERFSR